MDDNEYVVWINALTDEEVDKLISADKCPYEPERIKSDAPIGMFHCPICGEMVLAGVPHPRKCLYDHLYLEGQEADMEGNECQKKKKQK